MVKIKSEKAFKDDVKKEGFNLFKEFWQNINTKKPKKSDVIAQLYKEALDRTTTDIGKWRSAVEAAEDVQSPDREELMQIYKDVIDDDMVYSSMQQRTAAVITGSFKIIDEDGEVDEETTLLFMDPKGFPLKWFRDFMKFVEDSIFYGYEILQLGDIENNIFTYTKKIPEENIVPQYEAILKDYRAGITSHNTLYINDPKYRTWLIGIGSKTDLGLLNKVTKYWIYKKVFGAWSQHADIFGMPLRIGKTDMRDKLRKQNMLDMLENMEGATYGVFDPEDMIEFVEQKGGNDPHNIYGKLIDECNKAIVRIILSQTGTTDEKSFSGSSNVHKEILDSLVLSDKLEISSIVNQELIPRMKKLGMISEGKKLFGQWDFSEKLSITEWTDNIWKLSQAGFTTDAEIVRDKTGIEVEKIDPVDVMPENKGFSNFAKMNKFYNIQE